ncbi:hypothetical protein FBU30_002584 [Linnemannia zychae]|nr:hypothetical protein FBU30_002584 [Linnemannia zychae]
MTKAKSPRRGTSPPASSTRTSINTNTGSIGAAAAALHAATNGNGTTTSPPPSPKQLKHHNHHSNSGPTAASKEVNFTNVKSHGEEKNGVASIVVNKEGNIRATGQDQNPSFSSASSSSTFSFFSSISTNSSIIATLGSGASAVSSSTTLAYESDATDGANRSPTSILSPTALGFLSAANLFSHQQIYFAASSKDQNAIGQQANDSTSSSDSSNEGYSDMDEDSESESSVSSQPSEDEDEEEETDLDYDETSEEEDDDNGRTIAVASFDEYRNKAARKKQPSTLLKRTLNKRHVQWIQEQQKQTSPELSPSPLAAISSSLNNSSNNNLKNNNSLRPFVHHHPEAVASIGKGSDKEPVVLLADQSAKAKWANWSTRTLWTLIMIAGFFACFAAGPLFVILLVVMVQGLVYKEVIFLAAVPSKEKKLPWFRSMHWYFLFSTNYFFYGESLIHYFQHVVFVDAFLLPFATHHRFISFALYVTGFVFFVANLKKGHYRFQFSQFAWTHMTLLLVVCQSHFIINNIFEGLIWFFLPASLVIANDIWAYIFGFFMGRTPLIKLSPKKTVEGFVGGWLMTIVFGLFFATFLLKYPYMICPVKDLRASAFSGLTCDPNPVFIPVRHNLKPWMVSLIRHLGFRSTYVMIAPLQWHVIIMGCFASLIAPFGGFFASGFKRAFKIKDFGQSIPGHGGITDRMDCQFLMGLFSYMYYQSFIKTSAVTTGLVLQAAIKLKSAEQMELFDHLKQYLIGQGLLDEESCVIMPPKEAWVS